MTTAPSSDVRTTQIGRLRPDETSRGSGICELSTTVGGAIGAAVITAVLAANVSARLHVVTQSGFRDTQVSQGLTGRTSPMRRARVPPADPCQSFCKQSAGRKGYYQIRGHLI
jgi:hypothetical protein